MRRILKVMIERLFVETTKRTQLVDISAGVERIVAASGVDEGFCLLHVLHTTAGVTVNENADPSVCDDIIDQLARIVPFEGAYKHREGNSDAHVKASLVGFSESLFVEKGSLLLGTWQGIYLCEFDGPRRRHLAVKVIPDRDVAASR